MIRKLSPCLLWFALGPATGVEQQVRGLLDARYTATDGIDSYLDGDYGKFRFDDGEQLSLAQGALAYRLDWDNGLGLQVVANAYADGVNDSIGFSEAWLQYRGLPSEHGYRLEGRAGFLYPRVTMTNLLTGWASPYSLNYSMIDAWLAEELRHRGVEISLARLGRFTSSEHDLELSLTLFQNNDPAGAMLAWHGWTASSRQSLRHESLPLPNSHIGFVPEKSDVFLELDDDTGYHLSVEWTRHGRTRLLFGYYDNRADPTVVNDDVQWGWRTRFTHLGVKWRLADDLDLVVQHLVGDTLMQSTSGAVDLVNNDFESSYLMLSKKLGRHRISGRVDIFSVTDNDAIAVDDNDEDGEAVTLNYTFRYDRNWFLHTEFNWIDSERPSRADHAHPERLIERQLQFGARYFF